MRYAYAAGVVLLCGFAVWWYASAQNKSQVVADLRGQSAVSVVLGDEGFNPSHVRISLGTTVTFSTTRDKNFWPASNTHPTHSLYPDFDPRRPLSPHEMWQFTFTEPGERGYHDHVRSYYTGIMYVE